VVGAVTTRAAAATEALPFLPPEMILTRQLCPRRPLHRHLDWPTAIKAGEAPASTRLLLRFLRTPSTFRLRAQLPEKVKRAAAWLETVTAVEGRRGKGGGKKMAVAAVAVAEVVSAGEGAPAPVESRCCRRRTVLCSLWDCSGLLCSQGRPRRSFDCSAG